MDPKAGFDPLPAGVTFTGSLLSFIATTTVLICFVCYRHEQQSFRHALIFNLALAEFINTLNNTISGSIYLRTHALYNGPACVANGFIGQLSVQAADFSILSIAIVTLLTITRTTYLPAASTAKKVTICLSVWVIPIITAITATSLNAMGPVSGNWCWIMSTRTDLRYALTHGWRIAIIFCTAAIYLFVWWFMHRHFRSLVSTDASSKDGSWISRRRGFKKMKDGAGRGEEQEDTELSTISKSRISRVVGDDWELSAPEAAYVGSNEVHGDIEEGGRQQRRRQRRDSIDSISSASDGDDDYQDYHDKRVHVHVHAPPLQRRPTGPSKFDGLGTTDTTTSEFPTRRQTRHMEREIKKMLLLNAYPIMYVLLWIPGLVNRFMEATGHSSNSRVLAALQASSQFVGLANALTYGFNAKLRRKVRRWWRQQKRSLGSGGEKRGGGDRSRRGSEFR
ncbi:hypothetical protein N0V82_010753 [Gnomoniopsis sp. IMI 355080]|nr:hypothetical protein N0V82_010753 [Gnomoniopsis sp. IMI 355080]